MTATAVPIRRMSLNGKSVQMLGFSSLPYSLSIRHRLSASRKKQPAGEVAKFTLSPRREIVSAPSAG